MIKTKLIVGAAALAAVGLALAGCANTGSGTKATTAPKINLPVITTIQTPADAVLPKGDGNAKCPANTTLAYVGAETGANAALGINIYNGVQLAITQHNQANPGCQVKFLKFDTEGDPTKATGPVTQAVNTPGIIGVVGLPFSGESQATGNIFQQKGLVHITPSATNPGLTKNGWTTFFRALGNDNQQGPAAAQFVTKTLKLTKVFLVQDDSDYGIGLATAVGNALGKDEVGSDKVITGQKDFSSTVQKVLSSKATAVYYSGYYAEGAPFDQQLVNKGYKGVFIGPDGVKDPQFIKQAGSASSNAYFTCPCIPGELIPSFESAYKSAFGTDPGTYSIEGYDATTVLLAGIDKGNQTRASLLSWVTNYNADGLSKHYQWTSTGELTKATVYGYEVKDGQIVPIGVIGNK